MEAASGGVRVRWSDWMDRTISWIGLTFGGDIFTAVAFLIGNGLERNLADAAMDVIYRSRNSIAARSPAPPAVRGDGIIIVVVVVEVVEELRPALIESGFRLKFVPLKRGIKQREGQSL